MLYLVKDKHGFTVHVIKVKTSKMTKHDVDATIARFIKMYNLETSIDFDIELYQLFMWRTYSVYVKICKFDVANLKV